LLYCFGFFSLIVSFRHKTSNEILSMLKCLCRYHDLRCKVDNCCENKILFIFDSENLLMWPRFLRNLSTFLIPTSNTLTSNALTSNELTLNFFLQSAVNQRITSIQLNLSTATTFGTQKYWPLFTGGRCSEVIFMSWK